MFVVRERELASLVHAFLAHRHDALSLAQPIPDVQADHPVVARLRREVTLAQAARSGGAWLAISSVMTQGAQFLISLVMAHLLLPRQFGETALAYAITGFGQVFTDLGIGAAVVQARYATGELLCSAFWLNAWSGLALTLLLSGLALPIADLYGNPQLTGLIIVASLTFSLNLGTVHLSILERTFHFRKVATVESLSALAGFVAMPLAVLSGCGVYSVVIGPVVTVVVSTVWLWVATQWLPRGRATRSGIRELWQFSRGLVGFNAVNYWARNLDNVLLGGTVPQATLGEYNRAYNLMMIPVAQVGAVFMRGLYPSLVRMRDEPQRMGRAYIRATTAAISAVAFPVSFVLAATAPALITVLYGSRWSGAITLLELLALGSVPQVMASSLGGPYRAAGKTDLLFKIGVFSTAATALAIVAGLPWGAAGVAVALLIRSWLLLPALMAPLALFFQVSLFQLSWPLLRAAAPGLASGLTALGVRLLLAHHVPMWAVLVLQLAAAGLVLLVILWRSDAEVVASGRARLRSFRAARSGPPLDP